MSEDDRRRKDVARELTRLAERRISQAFEPASGQEELSLPNLSRLTRALRPAEWERDRTTALRNAIKAVVGNLPIESIGYDAKTTWVELAHNLYNLADDDLDHIDGKKYDYLVRTAFEQAGIADLPEDTRRNITARLRRKLAAVILQMERKAADGTGSQEVPNTQQSDTPPTSRGKPTQAKEQLGAITGMEVRPPFVPRMEGDLKLAAGVANVTRGDTAYAKSVTAWADDVVKIQITYESTATIRALRDFVPYFRLPSRLGGEHCVVVGGTALGGHVAEVLVTIKATLPSTLMYVRNSAKWRHNTALSGTEPTYEIVHIDDSVVLSNPLPLDNVLSGSGHRATITILVKVVSNQVSVRLLGTSELTKKWRQDIAAPRGAVVHMRLVLQNRGNRPLKSLLVYCNIAPRMSLIAGSTSLKKPDGVVQELTDQIVRGTDPTGQVRPEQAEDGLSIGDLPVGETLYVDFDVRIEAGLPVSTMMTIVGCVRPLGMNEFYNTVKVAVQR